MTGETAAKWIKDEIVAIERSDAARLAEDLRPGPPLADQVPPPPRRQVQGEGLVPFSEAVSRLAEMAGRQGRTHR
ncbi:hypothetical protein [Rhodococcus sp. IEGM 1318]|uniref:hypothetical protein n=1 Tax=Rhodococcus sp. IEGM 1318 TaxID=3082226 RepID=UPI00295406E9|nr:hypothetical protein [Rhodococcus sp. IEGM 1318]MDV8008630.1 hypothetical protein [Rhodococcus sp. IEGM 1318]